ncbi:hypothetical protein BB560_002821 [Smittium megazygosporum]|uniref:Methylthioribose-1-phosphate isomerase n=1 Tax=Smittium megazygosporum TaxID=133381 RepID=A0A2T9ZDQ3_9FUNG|nr:hypothetical protein BB560_002821 [Smittium megazygosporum]
MSSSDSGFASGTLQSILWERPTLHVLDQLVLPMEKKYIKVETVQDTFDVIRNMNVRGAPLIAIVAALGLASHLVVFANENSGNDGSFDKVLDFSITGIKKLRLSRPTAVNLFEAMDILEQLVESLKLDLNQSDKSEQEKVEAFVNEFVAKCEWMKDRDIADNLSMGNLGSEYLISKHYKTNADQSGKFSVLTHCNTGSLATAGYGTALGIIRSCYKANLGLDHVYCTETRPYNQGSRLTAFELDHDKIPYTLITDSMKTAPIKAIIVGADRVCANGDVANKIGTFQLSLIANHYGIDFIIAAPTTTIDLSLPSGSHIPIESRSSSEILTASGTLIENDSSSNRNNEKTPQRVSVAVAPDSFNVWNPAFDVTPAKYITAIVTETCVFLKDPATGEFDLSSCKK